MKKILSVLFVVALLTSMLTIVSSADIEENPTINVPSATPTIDGNIDASEGWSSAAYLNEKTSTGAWGTMPLTTRVDFYFAASNEGLYFAAKTDEIGAAYRVRFYDEAGQSKEDRSYIDANAASYTLTEGGYPTTTPDGIAINYYMPDSNSTNAPAGVIPDTAFMGSFYGNTFIACTGEDDIDETFGFNGDLVGLNLDLLGEFDAEQFYDNSDKLPTYYFGLFNDGTVKVYRAEFSEADITSECKTAGKQSGSGFVFEALIPWSTLVDDANTAGAEMGLEHTYTVDEVKKAGATHRGSVLIIDRYADTETGENDTWGRFITVCNTTSTGISGAASSGNNILCYGLHLTMTGSDAADTTAAGADTTAAAAGATTTAAGATTTKAGATTTAAGATTKPAETAQASQETAAQTFDAGVAVALGAMMCSGIGIGFAKKKKDK